LVKVGVGRTVTVVATVAEQPAEFVHVAEYVVVTMGMTTIDVVLALVDQISVPPVQPPTVSDVDSPAQAVAEFTVNTGVGG
jgi:starvation-inducible outer membrane lipoprotein